MSIPGQPSYMPYSSPYNGSQYDFMGGYRNYMPPNPYAQNQLLNSQNNMLPNIQQNQQMNNNIQFALIPSREVAQNATAEKGQTIYMMNQNNPEIYMKAADGFGLQSTRYFKLVEFNPEQENQQNQMIQQNVDYIPRDEFNQFANAASNEIAALKQQIMSMSQQSTPIVETDIKPTTNTSTSTNTKKTTNTKESK